MREFITKKLPELRKNPDLEIETVVQAGGPPSFLIDGKPLPADLKNGKKIFTSGGFVLEIATELKRSRVLLYLIIKNTAHLQ